MRSQKSYIIWMPKNGSGRPHNFLISPFLVIIISSLLFLCVCAVPVLENRLFNLQSKVSHLEQKKDDLSKEITSLQYLRKTLARIEEKEKVLRGYFGMEQFRFLEQLMGAGGTPDLEDCSVASPNNLGTNDNAYRRLSTSYANLPAKLETLHSNYEILNKLLEEKDKAWKYTPNIMPVEIKRPKISSGFGWRKNPFTNRREFHVGIDIIGKKGAKIIAPASGVVINRGRDRWLGKYLVVQHTEKIKTIYGHLSKFFVDKGALVKRGDTLGLMGNSGLSTGSHLHYAVTKNDRAVNPMEYILDGDEG